jgi:arylsulfatase A-like enzyme
LAARGGFAVMPRLADFAEAGLRFSGGAEASPGPDSSLATVITGLRPETHGVEPGEDQPETPPWLPDRFETAAAWLSRQGYATFAVETSARLDRASGFARGFGRHDYIRHEDGNAEWVTEQALGGAWGMSEPFYLQVRYADARAPYTTPVHYEPPWDSATTAPDDEQDPAVQYDAVLHFVDRHAGELITRLRHDFPDTLFVITGDHNVMPENHPGTPRVPLFFFGPGAEARSVDVPASLPDILPTLAGLLGLAPDISWEGRDMRGVQD